MVTARRKIVRHHPPYLRLLTLVAAAGLSQPGPAHAQTASDGPTVDLHGFVRLDVIFDDSRMQNPQFPFFVLSEPDGSDPELTIHPRLTRVGLDAEQRLEDTVDVAGKIEIDFQAGGSESRQLIRLRHGYLALESGMVEVLAGQTWDLISPLWPAANNDGMMWNAGNLGDRRPQLRVTALPALGAGTLRLAAAAGLTGAIDGQDVDMNGRPDGLDATLPTAQMLAEMRLAPLLGGVWAHYARESLDDGTDFESLAVGAHVKLDITEDIWVQGEGWYGQNLDDVRGGIGQNVNAGGEEIRSTGGWIEAGARPLPPYQVAVGFTIDDPIDEDVDPGARERNMALYLAQQLRPWKPVMFALEYLFWTTDYQDAARGRAHRVDAHASFFF